MERFDMIVIGFGKAGKTLSSYFANKGKNIAMIEESDKMYGGTCINIGCIPTKTLIQSVKDGANFSESYQYRDLVTDKLRNKNYHKLKDNKNIQVFDGQASFLDNKVIEVNESEGKIQLTSEIIVVNTGSRPFIPDINGIDSSKNIYDSTSLQDLRNQPESLGIIGAGNIGLEFASLYSLMGTKVYLFNRSSNILENEEAELANLASKYLQEDGVEFVNNYDSKSLSNNELGQVILDNGHEKYTVDALLIATGRMPNTKNLALENTNIKVDEKGFIKVDEHLETNVRGIYAVGDINGGPQFTYISLDDFRIVRNHLEGNNEYTLNNRKNIPHTHFLNPPLASVGLREKEARKKGYSIKSKVMDVSNMPRAHVNNDTRGRFKAVIDRDTSLILGASFLGKEAEELINIVKLAMDNDISYKKIKNQVFTHPSMAENLNDLFDI